MERVNGLVKGKCLQETMSYFHRFPIETQLFLNKNAPS